MNVDFNSFTPVLSLLGGIMLGVAAAWLILFNGKVAGVSGILGGLLTRSSIDDKAWRMSFLIGVLVAPVVYTLIYKAPEVSVLTPYPVVALAGLIVGFGTRYGSGCTSGHGICGLSRLSGRSLVATLCFMLTGFVSVAIIRHGIGLLN